MKKIVKKHWKLVKILKVFIWEWAQSIIINRFSNKVLKGKLKNIEYNQKYY